MTELNLPRYSFRVKEENGKQFIFDTLRKRYVLLTPEEWVRQHFVAYLIQDKGYPSGRIGNEISLLQNGRKRRSDTVVYDVMGNPFIIIEYKAPHINITQEVFNQIIRYNSVLKVRYLIVSNGLQHFCCRVDYEHHKCDFLSEIPTYDALSKE